MSTEAKKSYGSTAALVLFGLLALLLGTHWLALLVPAAILVWYGAPKQAGSGRN